MERKKVFRELNKLLFVFQNFDRFHREKWIPKHNCGTNLNNRALIVGPFSSGKTNPQMKKLRQVFIRDVFYITRLPEQCIDEFKSGENFIDIMDLKVVM